MKKATLCPKDFRPDDSDREWATKNGYPLYICEQYVQQMIDWSNDPNTRRSIAVKKDWHRALRNWVRREARSNSWRWEQACMAAKERERQQYKRSTPPPQMRQDSAGRTETYQPMPPDIKAVWDSMRREMRERMGK